MMFACTVYSEVRSDIYTSGNLQDLISMITSINIACE